MLRATGAAFAQFCRNHALNGRGAQAFPLSALSDEFGAQHQALDGVVATVDLLGIAGETYGLDDRAALQRLVGALYLEILDQDDAVAVSQQVADRIADFDASRSLFGRGLLGGCL